MDPQLRSVLTTVLAVLLGSVATYLVKSGIITADQTNAFEQGAIGVILALGAAGVTWWKSRRHTPAAQMLAIETMTPAQANAAVQSLPVSAKNAIELAAMPDATIATKAGALPGVSVTINPQTASAALVAVATDPAQPGVNLTGAKP